MTGKAAHAGLDPTGGASAILEMSHLVQALHAMTDLDRGLTVNVGVISGGTRSNVIAPEARREVDVRVLSMEDGDELEEKIRSLTTTVPGTSLEIEGGFTVPPLERTPRNRALWEAALGAGRELGMELEEDVAGGGSDGNTTSQFTATLDGIGPGRGRSPRSPRVPLRGQAGGAVRPSGSPPSPRSVTGPSKAAGMADEPDPSSLLLPWRSTRPAPISRRRSGAGVSPRRSLRPSS